MAKPLFAVCALAVGTAVLGTGVASGQNYPSQPIRIVTTAAGGAADFSARLLGQGIAGPLGQPVIVDNRGIIAIELAVKAPPNGYTLLYYGSPLWIGPLLQKMPYDPVRDLSPIMLVGSLANVIVVHPSVPVKSIKELIAVAKARPGELNYASGSTGSTAYLAGELFKAMAGVKIVRIPYKGGASALIDLLAGNVQMTIDGFSLLPYMKAGKVRPLAVTSLQKSALFPDLPTVAASGLPGYESVAQNGILAPAKTPAAIINRLNQESVRFLNMPSAKAELLSTGVEAIASTPDEFAATIKSEMAKWGKIIKDAGIKTD